ncbi:MAG: Bcr/CflA family multidrug efflux MFS transporter [Chloroflexi bacterium]|nr:Bcr/CflA family multidrug efflux MFS transporter [Chloroflexota bacterium]
MSTSQPQPAAVRPASRRQPPVSQPNASRLKLVLILGALGAFGPLSIDMYLPALPALTHDFGTGASEVQLTLSAFFFGLALGQAIVGPLSDALGRRRPLLIGLGAYALASLLCATAPNIWALVGFRFVQGFAGAAGMVVSRAIVRDLYTGVAAARFMSVLMLVGGLAPILAPILGGQLLQFSPWQGIFLFLALFGGLLWVAIERGLGETLPAGRRQTEGLRGTLVTFRTLLTDRRFMGYAVACGLAIAAMFSYISGSSFVFQSVYGVSPQTFSFIFGGNAIGLLIMGQVNGRLVGRVAPIRMLTIGLCAAAVGGLTLLLVVLSGDLLQGVGLFAIVPSLFLVVASLGLIMPNATVLALSGSPKTAGAASALLGVLQFSLGAGVAPIVGMGGAATALPMALLIAVLELCALGALAVLTFGIGLQRPLTPREMTTTSPSGDGLG